MFISCRRGPREAMCRVRPPHDDGQRLMEQSDQNIHRGGTPVLGDLNTLGRKFGPDLVRHHDRWVWFWDVLLRRRQGAEINGVH